MPKPKLSYKKNAARRRLVLSVTAVSLFSLLALVTLIYQLSSGFQCPVLALTHLPCPGCGLTRAFASLLRLDPLSAFRYHPLFFVPPMMAVTGAVSVACKKLRIPFLVIFLTLAAAMLICWAVRLSCGWRGI